MITGMSQYVTQLPANPQKTTYPMHLERGAKTDSVHQRSSGSSKSSRIFVSLGAHKERLPEHLDVMDQRGGAAPGPQVEWRA
jgi:hypothetical protein